MPALFISFLMTRDPRAAHSTHPCFLLADRKQPSDVGALKVLPCKCRDSSLQMNKLTDMPLMHLENEFCFSCSYRWFVRFFDIYTN